MAGVLEYLRNFLSDQDASLVHIALWTAVQLARFPNFLQELVTNDFEKLISHLTQSLETDAVRELAQILQEKLTSC